MARVLVAISAVFLALWSTTTVVDAKKPANCPPDNQYTRYAVLIGNEKYDKNIGELKNPKMDIDALERVLKKAGFKVRKLPNLDYADLLAEPGRFKVCMDHAAPGAVGLFYYAGHGAARKEDNHGFLFPVSVKTLSKKKDWDNAVPLSSVLNVMRDVRDDIHVITIIDACRNELNLKQKSWEKPAGDRAAEPLVPAPDDKKPLMVVYSTKFGTTTPDDHDFAKYLSQEIDAARTANEKSQQNWKHVFESTTAKLRNLRTNLPVVDSPQWAAKVPVSANQQSPQQRQPIFVQGKKDRQALVISVESYDRNAAPFAGNHANGEKNCRGTERQGFHNNAI